MNDTSIAPWGMKTPRLSAEAERVISAIARKKSSAGVQGWLQGDDDLPGGGATLVNAFQQSVWVYSCITTLGENVSGIPFRMVTGDGEDERVMNGGEGKAALAGTGTALFNRPHPQLDRFQFWELLVSWLMLRGEVFVAATTDDDEVVAPGAAGFRGAAITRLHILSPDRFREVVGANCLEGWHYQCSERDGTLASHDFLPGEVIHIKLPNPFNFWRGLSPLTSGMLAAQTDYASAQFMKGLILNNADTGLIVTSTAPLEEEQRQQILAAMRERKRSAGTADRPAMLEAGVKVEKPTLTSSDLQFLENRKFNRQEICAIYKVPQELLGFSEDANRAIADAVRMSFMENRIAPLCRRIEAGIDPIIKSFDRQQRGEFHVKGTPIMQAAQRTRVDSAVKVWGMAVPFNEVNRAYDLGFPKLPWGGKGYLAANVREVGEAMEDSKGGKGAGEKGGCDGAKTGGEFERMAALLRESNVGGGEKPNEQNRNAGASRPHPGHTEGAVVAASVKGKAGKLRKFFFEQRGRVLAACEAGKAIDWAADDAELLAKMGPLLRGDLEMGARSEAGECVASDEAHELYAAQRSGELRQINVETRRKVEGALTEASAADEEFAQVAQRVKEIFQRTSDEFAERIAEKETLAAVKAGRWLGMMEAACQSRVEAI